MADVLIVQGTEVRTVEKGSLKEFTSKPLLKK